ncbi:MAG: DUF3024 domain-containing protein [Pseudomonadota bacterium]|uniref:DUF3024 domain-containing protein n=1 Tax=Vibrio campbellii TaxID=680 RepID=A0AAE9N191_9VIBR|nr:DUF3024 domain-containing protein [Vibrio campbellii]AXB34183.1 DUF3024 domain-containing protein [Vibrio campbellii]MED5505372.1 DUF3024 domain-containing protein [Pseudomonadota bacterium]UTZ28755.1 DUF3024 domain-containing protein [Vibrio campbellii]
MSVSQMATSRLHKLVQTLCARRNVNLPVEAIGKCLYEPIENGVELYHAHFLLDSQHSEYTSPIAKILFDVKTQLWCFYVPTYRGEDLVWVPYERLPMSETLEVLLAELESDPQACFWD